MIIRKAEEKDAARALALYGHLIDVMKDSPYRPTWTKGLYPSAGDLDPAIREGRLWIAEEAAGTGPEGGEPLILGAVIRTSVQSEGYERVPWKVDAAPERVTVLHLLAVRPETQGRGVGRALMEAMIRESRAEGDDAIRLDTLPYNAPGRHLYEQCGFRYCGDISLWYPSTGSTPFCMYEYAIREENIAPEGKIE